MRKPSPCGGFFCKNSGMKLRKYSQQYDVVAYRSIALGGVDSAAWQSLDISDRTFYKWCQIHPTFRSAVEKGRAFHQKASPDALRLALLSHIIDTLHNRGEAVRTETRVVQRTVQRDGRNRVILITESETVTEITENRGLPKWVADKVMANAPGLSEAIAKVLNAGYEIEEGGVPEQGLMIAPANNQN
jgi:hypothetical protein